VKNVGTIKTSAEIASTPADFTVILKLCYKKYRLVRFK